MKKTLILFIAFYSLGFCKQEVDLIIKNGQILTINEDRQIIFNGAIVIDKSKIVAVGDSQIADIYNPKKLIDANNGIVMPGMINTHTHTPMIAFRSLGEEGIKNRLFAYFFPLEAEKLSRDLIYKATIHGSIEMAFGGVTTYADMYYHADEMAKATKEVGIRGVIGETIIKFPVVDAPIPYGGLEYAKEFIKDYIDDDLIVPALAPHAVYTVSKDKLQEISMLSNEYKIPVLIHINEFDDEDKRLNLDRISVIEYLQNIDFLNERTLLAHAIYLNDKDLQIIKDTNATISYNPMANAKGATGIARAYEMLKLKIPVGLGTDGPMSSNQVDLFRVLSYASSMQRLKYNDRTIFTPQTVIELATIGGAKALNMQDKIGSIEVGKLADIIIIETTSPNMIPNYDPYATLVFAANASNVVTTVVNGRVIIEDRKLLTYDIDKNLKDMQEIENDIAKFAKELAIKAKELN